MLEQPVVFTAMRIVTFGAAVSVDRISIDRRMFIRIRTAHIAVAVLADPVEIVRLIVILLADKLMAGQAGHCSLANRMSRAAHKVALNVIVAIETELRLGIPHQGRCPGMNRVAAGTIEALQIVGVESVGIKFRMRIVALAAQFERLLAGHMSRVADVVLRWFLDMLLSPLVAAHAVHREMRAIVVNL